MKPSLNYWHKHRSLLPVFKKPEPTKSEENKVQLEDEEDVDILIVGPINSGKSQLMKCLSDEFKEISDKFYKVEKTVSTEIFPIKFKDKPLNVQEVNWSFLKSWHHYYEVAKMIFFVCDISDKANYSPTIIEMSQLIPKFNRPMALVFNKIDKIEGEADSIDYLMTESGFMQ